MIDSLASVDLSELLIIRQNKSAKLAGEAFLFFLEKRLTSNKFAFVEMNAKTKPAFIRGIELRNISTVIAIAFFKTKRIEHFIPADLHAEFTTRAPQQIPDHDSAVIGNVELPAKLARITNTLSVHPCSIDVNRLRR